MILSSKARFRLFGLGDGGAQAKLSFASNLVEALKF
jgi:hypothetical protein